MTVFKRMREGQAADVPQQSVQPGLILGKKERREGCRVPGESFAVLYLTDFLVLGPGHRVPVPVSASSLSSTLTLWKRCNSRSHTNLLGYMVYVGCEWTIWTANPVDSSNERP